MKGLIFAFCVLRITTSAAQENQIKDQIVGINTLLEITVENQKTYQNPYQDVELLVEFTSPDDLKVHYWGFYDGDNIWKIRFTPQDRGRWEYKYWFSDQPKKVFSGVFRCQPSQANAFVNKDKYNPFWMGYKDGKHQLFRSFHAGDRFFAYNWDDPNNQQDGNKRKAFLDWVQSQDYNMLSIASFMINRNSKGRGAGWEIPKLWPLDYREFRKMEVILDDLRERDIVVFPFAGFFGNQGEWPTNADDQELYIKYILARTGHYPNMIINVAGPEPLYRKKEDQYQGAMRLADIQRLGELIHKYDIHDHLVTVHNEKRATDFGDIFLSEPWYEMSTLQGPTTLNRDKLFSGLMMNHPINKPLYAQETLWTGNKNHPNYSDEQLRKNAMTILFAGGILNFADMDGNSSTGFSGSLNLEERDQPRHDIVKKVWDFFEAIPFYNCTTRQDLVDNGYCLANEGQEYWIYMDTVGKVNLFVDFPYSFQTEWINPQNPAEKIQGPTISKEAELQTPTLGSDWVLHVWAERPEQAATGHFPDIATDASGNVHLVYNHEGLTYRKFDIESQQWLIEEEPGCLCENVKRSDPDVVIDSNGMPHVFCGSEYAYKNSKGKWIKVPTTARRDSELMIDKNDNVYIVHRGGNGKGHIGFQVLKKGSKKWEILPDPDEKNPGENNHVYTDGYIDQGGVIHLVQRHGPEVEVTYRASKDHGKTWPIEMPVSDDRKEAPHIIVNKKGDAFITTGSGLLFQLKNNSWINLGRVVEADSREQPELGQDQEGNIYVTSFGGRYNVLYNNNLMREQRITKINKDKVIGFVETAPGKDFVYVVWEEGEGNPDEGLEENSSIYVGRLYPDGRVIGLKNGKPTLVAK